MARAGWLNENEYRAYPFLHQPAPVAEALPSQVIADFGAIMDADAGFSDELGHTVWLSQIRREGALLFFTFATDATDAVADTVTFVRDITDPEFTMEWADAGDVGSVSGAAGCDGAKWSAFLITGTFAELAVLLPGDGTLSYTAGFWTVEPAQIQNLAGTYVRSLNLANFPRVTATGCDGSSSASASASSSSSAAESEIIVNARCLQSDREFEEGYNCSILQDDQNNTLIINGARGEGAGEPCEEVPLYEGETGPDGSPFLSGGPACREIVKTVNGKGGPQLRINAGPGFRVYSDPDNPNTLVVERRLDDFAVCLGDV